MGNTYVVATLKQFIMMCVAYPGMAYEIFEEDTTEEVRDLIYSLADPKSPEPFRSAMINIGFTDY